MGNGKELVLENQFLKLTVNPQKATFSCLHKTADVIWDADPWQDSLGFITLENSRFQKEQVNLSSARKITSSASANSLTLQLSDFKCRLETYRDDRALGSKISVELEFTLNPVEPSFTFAINKLNVDSKFWKLEKVVAPLRHFYARTAADDGCFLLPDHQGSIIPTRYNKGYFRYLNWMWEEIAGFNQTLDSLSMPWFGAIKGDSGFAAIIETPYDAALDIVANNITTSSRPYTDRSGEVLSGGVAYTPRITVASPVWKASRRELGYARKCTYKFAHKADITKLAKIYREQAIRDGYFKSLKEKIAENPNVSKLIGGPDIKVFMVTNRVNDPEGRPFHGPVWDGYHEVSTTFPQLRDMVKEMGEMGIDRGMIHVGGWATKGYDNWRPIDTLPVNEEAGGEKGLQDAADEIKKTSMLCTIHDNYRNMDLNAPSYDEDIIGVDYDGSLQPGFSSDSGISHQICSARQLELLKNTSKYMKDTIGATGYFLDTITSVALSECYHDEHPITRKQDAEHKSSLLKHLKDIGMVLGAESGQYWGVRYCDFFEGLMDNRFGLTVPLFNLVFHDAAIVHWQHARPYNYGHPRGNFADKVLMGLLYGNSNNWVMSSYVYPGWKKQLKEVHELTTGFHRKIALEEMVEYKIYSDDYLVQGSKFSDGTRVYINQSSDNFTLGTNGNQLTVPFRGFIIEYPDGKKVSGQVEYQILKSEE